MYRRHICQYHYIDDNILFDDYYFTVNIIIFIFYQIIIAITLIAGPSCAAIPQIASSDTHTLVLLANGSIWGWGSNQYGAIGDGSTVSRSSPVLVGRNFFAISAGLGTSYAIKTDGSLWAWGKNESGQVGDGTRVDRWQPVRVGEDFVSVVGTWFSAAAIKRDGSLWTWGANINGILGDSRAEYHIVDQPRKIEGKALAIASSHAHVLSLSEDGSVFGWGLNDVGQIGSDNPSRDTPAIIDRGYRSVTAGEHFSLGIKGDGTLWAWGWNGFGQLGISDPRGENFITNVTSPVRVPGENYVAVTTASFHTHALRSDGSLWGWGAGMYGAVGDGIATNPDGSAHNVLSPVKIGEGFWRLPNGGGNNNGFAIDLAGEVWAWGANSGSLGDGGSDNRLVPGRIGLNVYERSGVTLQVMVNGPIERQTIAATIAPNQADTGTPACAFVAAVLPDGQVLLRTSDAWITYDPANPQAFACGRAVAISVPLIENADLRALVGTTIYLGYGRGDTQEVALSDMFERGLISMAHAVGGD